MEDVCGGPQPGAAVVEQLRSSSGSGLTRTTLPSCEALGRGLVQFVDLLWGFREQSALSVARSWWWGWRGRACPGNLEEEGGKPRWPRALGAEMAVTVAMVGETGSCQDSRIDVADLHAPLGSGSCDIWLGTTDKCGVAVCSHGHLCPWWGQGERTGAGTESSRDLRYSSTLESGILCVLLMVLNVVTSRLALLQNFRRFWSSHSLWSG